MAGFLRFLCSFLSGVLIWGNLTDGLPAWTYSLVYNGSYMLPETLLTMVAAVLLCRVAPQIFDRQSRKGLEKSVLSYILCSPAGPKTQQGIFAAKNFQKPVDNLPLGWYNYTRRQEHDAERQAIMGV